MLFLLRINSALTLKVDKAFVTAKVYLPFDTSKVPNGDIQNVKMFYFDEVQRTMLPLDNQGIDQQNGVVWGETNHFTTFVLFYIPNWNAVWEAPLNKGERTVTTQTTYMDVALVLDSSGSMSWNDPSGYRKTAAKSFVNALISGDKAAVVDFDSYAYLTQSLTTDFNAVKSAIDRIDASGGTNIGAGVRVANNELINKSTSDRIKVEILLTDGQGSYDYSLTTQAKNNNIVIYTIGLGSSVNASLLTSIAQGTGGMYFPVSSASQLPDVFSRITEIITDPVDTDGDGLTDGDEEEYGTKLFDSDTDGDGLDDSFELLAGYDPLDTNSDGDTFDDKEEYDKELDPYIYDDAWYEHIKYVLAGAVIGDGGQNLVNWGLMSEQTFKAFVLDWSNCIGIYSNW